jgi:hypothetical protein
LAPEFQGSIELLHDKATELQLSLSADFSAMLKSLHEVARREDSDPEFLEALESARSSLEAWIDNGLGKTKDRWIQDAARQLKLHKGPGGVAEGELNRIRVEIGNHFGTLDRYLLGKEEGLLAGCAELLRSRLGTLLPEGDGRIVLTVFRNLLDGSSEACPTLVAAVDDLLNLEIRYRSQLHPRMRQALDELSSQFIDPETGRLTSRDFAVSLDEAGAEELLTRLTQMATKAAYGAYKELLMEGKRPALILHAAAEHFDDHLLRAENSEREFRRLSRSYRDEIWPDVFSGVDMSNARVAKVKRAISESTNLLAQMK